MKRARAAAGTSIRGIVQDTRHAYRALRHSPGFAVWVVGSLAIGMAVAIGALALLNALLRLPFPAVTDQSRLVRVSVSRNCGRPDCWTRMASDADYAALREGLHGLEGLAAYAPGDVAAFVPDARSLRAVFASANYFDVLGVRPALGRLFDGTDEANRTAVAVIAHGTWVREFAADARVIGRSIRIAGDSVEIVGVAPPLFAGVDRVRPGGRAPEIWLPSWLAGRVLPPAASARSPQTSLSFAGRLAGGVELSSVQAEVQVIAARLAAAHSPAGGGSLAEVRRVWRVDPKNWHFGVMVVMPIPILVLAIACVNAANLMLARGSRRQRNIAIRLALGAARVRIVRELLIESALLAFVATLAALPAAWWALQLASVPAGTPIPFDPLVLALTVLAATATTLAFGLAPALRLSALQPSHTLGLASGRGGVTPWQSRTRRLLVTVQVALSLGLLATAWQLVGTIRSQAVSAGTPGHRLLIARFDLRSVALRPAEVSAFYDRLLAGATRLPGAEAAGLARPSSVWTFGLGAGPASVVVWRPSDDPGHGTIAIGGYAGGDLFDAVGLRVLAGRAFASGDRSGRPRVAVINETAAKNMNGPAVGGTLRVAARHQDFGSSIELRVVGVIEPALEPRYTPDGPPAPKVYFPSPIEPEPELALYVRTDPPAANLVQPVRDLVGRIDPRVPVKELGSLDELNERAYGYGPQLWLARAAVVVGLLGLLLATAGLYGVTSYTVSMRAREMAIRIAIGATPRAILTMVLGQAMKLAATGMVGGAASAVAVSRFIQSEYHGIGGLDSAALAASIGVFLAAMLLASAVPALRAARVNPVSSLNEQ